MLGPYCFLQNLKDPLLGGEVWKAGRGQSGVLASVSPC